MAEDGYSNPTVSVRNPRSMLDTDKTGTSLTKQSPRDSAGRTEESDHLSEGEDLTKLEEMTGQLYSAIVEEGMLNSCTFPLLIGGSNLIQHCIKHS